MLGNDLFQTDDSVTLTLAEWTFCSRSKQRTSTYRLCSSQRKGTPSPAPPPALPPLEKPRSPPEPLGCTENRPVTQGPSRSSAAPKPLSAEGNSTRPTPDENLGEEGNKRVKILTPGIPR